MNQSESSSPILVLLLVFALVLPASGCGSSETEPAKPKYAPQTAEQVAKTKEILDNMWIWPADGGPARDRQEDAEGCIKQLQADVMLAVQPPLAKLVWTTKCMRDKGWVGVELDDSAESGALTVVRVEPNSLALAAGLKEGDVLLAVNDVRFGSEDKEAWYAVKSEMQVGNTITYTVARKGYEKSVDVTLAQVPDEIMARWVGQHMLEHATIELAQNN